MAYFERMRDAVSEPFSPEIIRQRTKAGWQMVAIEWRRELPNAEAPKEGEFDEDVPYGLRLSDDCRRLTDVISSGHANGSTQTLAVGGGR